MPLKYTSLLVSLVRVPNRVVVDPETRICDRATTVPPQSAAANCLLSVAVGFGARWLLIGWCWSLHLSASSSRSGLCPTWYHRSRCPPLSGWCDPGHSAFTVGPSWRGSISPLVHH